MENNASYLGHPDKLFSITPSLNQNQFILLQFLLKSPAINLPPMFVHLFSDTFLSHSVLLQCFCCLYCVKWGNLFEASRIVKEVLWVPVLMVKMGVNSCLCTCVHVCVRAHGCVKINKCGSVVRRKHPFLASMNNPPITE